MANQQPESLATIAATVRNDGEKPKGIGLEATPQTEGLPTDSKKKADATKVLRGGVLVRIREPVKLWMSGRIAREI